MGLLSKAAAGGGSRNEPQGGLLNLISKKNQEKATNINNVTQEIETDSIFDSPSSSILSSDINSSNINIIDTKVMETLATGYSKYGDFQGVVIEALDISRLYSMVSGFGTAEDLAPGRALVLFSSKEDDKLIGAHLAKTISGKNIFSFKAHNPEEAFSLIKPYM